MLLNNQWVSEEIKGEKKPETNENTTYQKSAGYHKSSSKRDVYSDTGLP